MGKFLSKSRIAVIIISSLILGSIIVFISLLVATKEPEPTNNSRKESSVSKCTVNGYNKDLEYILKGVNLIRNTTRLGHLTVYGDNAFPILSGTHRSNSNFHPIVGGGRYGKGRYAVYAQENCLLSLNNYEDTNAKLLANVAAWVTAEKQNATAGLFVAHHDEERFQRVLNGQGINSTLSPRGHNVMENIDYLKGYDLLMINNLEHVNLKEVDVLAEYIASGGGIILCTLPRDPKSKLVSKQNSSSCPTDSFWGNKILKPMKGIAFVMNSRPYYVHSHHIHQTHTFNASHGYLKDMHAGNVWNQLKRGNQIASQNERQQTKSILLERLRNSPKELNFSSDIINEVAKKLSLSTKRENQTMYNDFNLGEMWINVKKALRKRMYVSEDKIEQINRYLNEQILKDNSCAESKLLEDVVTELIEVGFEGQREDDVLDLDETPTNEITTQGNTKQFDIRDKEAKRRFENNDTDDEELTPSNVDGSGDDSG